MLSLKEVLHDPWTFIVHSALEALGGNREYPVSHRHKVISSLSDAG